MFYVRVRVATPDRTGDLLIYVRTATGTRAPVVSTGLRKGGNKSRLSPVLLEEFQPWTSWIEGETI